jgi:VWFA-related protein
MNVRLQMTAALLLVTGTVAPLGQTPTFSSRVEAVRVDVLVTQDGQPVRGLRPADFAIEDNGVPQQVDLVSSEQLPLNVILTLDMSSSVAGEPLEHLRRAGRAVLDGLRTGDRAALITFSHVVAMGAPLTPDFGRIRRALDSSEAIGSTSLVDASYAGMVLGESDVGRSLVLVFSDGLDSAAWLSTDEVLDIAKRSDAVVYGVSAGQSPKPDFLADLSETTGGKLFKIESTKNLSAVFLTVLDEFRNRYLVSYSPRGVSPDGWHQLTVRVKRRNATVKARPGYFAGS